MPLLLFKRFEEDYKNHLLRQDTDLKSYGDLWGEYAPKQFVHNLLEISNNVLAALAYIDISGEFPQLKQVHTRCGGESFWHHIYIYWESSQECRSINLVRRAITDFSGHMLVNLEHKSSYATMLEIANFNKIHIVEGEDPHQRIWRALNYGEEFPLYYWKSLSMSLRKQIAASICRDCLMLGLKLYGKSKDDEEWLDLDFFKQYYEAPYQLLDALDGSDLPKEFASSLMSQCFGLSEETLEQIGEILNPS